MGDTEQRTQTRAYERTYVQRFARKRTNLSQLGHEETYVRTHMRVLYVYTCAHQCAYVRITTQAQNNVAPTTKYVSASGSDLTECVTYVGARSTAKLFPSSFTMATCSEQMLVRGFQWTTGKVISTSPLWSTMKQGGSLVYSSEAPFLYVRNQH